MEAGAVVTAGVADFSRDKTSWWNAKVDKFFAEDNQFKTLLLDYEHMRSPYIQHNENPTTLGFDKNSPDYEWENIVIRGNSLLNLTSGTADLASFEGNLSETWIWPRNDVSAMEFKGLFTNTFLLSLACTPPLSQLSSVL